MKQIFVCAKYIENLRKKRISKIKADFLGGPIVNARSIIVQISLETRGLLFWKLHNFEYFWVINIRSQKTFERI